LRARAGARLAIKLVNGLAEPTTLAFPGLRAANSFLAFGKPSLAAGAAAQAVVVPAESVRAFLVAQKLTPVSASPEDINASVVRVICVRK